MRKLYLVFDEEKFIRINEKDKTWKSILNDIENELDDKYLEEDKLEGITLNIEIKRFDDSDFEDQERIT